MTAKAYSSTTAPARYGDATLGALVEAGASLLEATEAAGAIRASLTALEPVRFRLGMEAGLLDAARLLVDGLHMELDAAQDEAAQAVREAPLLPAVAAPHATPDAQADAGTSLSDDLGAASAMAHEAHAVITAATDAYGGDQQLLWAAGRLLGNLRHELVRCAAVAARGTHSASTIGGVSCPA